MCFSHYDTQDSVIPLFFKLLILETEVILTNFILVCSHNGLQAIHSGKPDHSQYCPKTIQLKTVIKFMDQWERN